jgi:hypothetical protein
MSEPERASVFVEVNGKFVRVLLSPEMTKLLRAGEINAHSTEDKEAPE